MAVANFHGPILAQPIEVLLYKNYFEISVLAISGVDCVTFLVAPLVA